MDQETRRWLEELDEASEHRPQALSDLHQLLLRVAHGELGRRRGRHPLSGPELEDLAQQATDDAMVALIAKLGQFRGESRFTTWAFKFVVVEVSSKLGRHFWKRPTVTLDASDWDRLPERFGIAPDDQAARAEMVSALRQAVTEELTDHQRTVFVALVVDQVPLEALVSRMGTNRNAIYRTMFDARRKLRAALAANGHLGNATRSERSEAKQNMKPS